MASVIHSNLSMMFGADSLKGNSLSKEKSMEKLASGYKVNRSADDASGLGISEKMRSLIRTLDQGSRNMKDGVSWTNVGDGALDDVDSMLQRINELSIRALNETNSRSDRESMQAEIDALKGAIDMIGTGTRFNTQNVFSDYNPGFCEIKGNITWANNDIHAIISPDNDSMTIMYRETEDGPMKSVNIQLPEGSYTTSQISSMIDRILYNSGAMDSGIDMTYNNDGTFSVIYDGGEEIVSADGGLSYLLHDGYKGGSVGSLIGTTIFMDEDARLEIAPENNHLEFTMMDFAGNSQQISMDLPTGAYTRSEIIDMLNNELSGTPVEARPHGSSIMLYSEEMIVTKFRGNMFKIELAERGDIEYTSVFYDNILYGDMLYSTGNMKGAPVLTSSSRDAEHQFYDITSANNSLTLAPNGKAPVTIEIPAGRYSAGKMAETLNQLFKDNGLGSELQAEAYSENVYAGSAYTAFYGLRLTSLLKNSAKSAVGVSETSSAYDTLFKNRTYNVYNSNVNPVNETNPDKDAYVTGTRTFSKTGTFEINGSNNKFSLILDRTSHTVTIPDGPYDIGGLIFKLNEIFEDNSSLKDKVIASPSGSSDSISIRLTAKSGITNINTQAVSGNGGFRTLFLGYTTYSRSTGKSGNPSVSVSPDEIVPGSFTLGVQGSNGSYKTYGFTYPSSPSGLADLVNQINSTVTGNTVTTLNKFANVYARGSSTDRTGNSSVNTAGTTTVNPNPTTSTTGTWKSSQGMASSSTTDPSETSGAKLTLNKTLNGPIRINNTDFELTINGVTKSCSLSLAAGNDYSISEVKEALQEAIDKEFHTHYGGAVVSIDGSRLVLTARVDRGDGTYVNGRMTNIDWPGGALLSDLTDTRSAGTARSADQLNSTITITGDTNTFKFTINGKEESVTLDPGTYSRSSLVNQLKGKLASKGADAALNGNYLMLSTLDQGSGNTISFTNASLGAMKALFGPLDSATSASAVVNRDLESSITLDASRPTFNININGVDHSINLFDAGFTAGVPYDRSSFISKLDSALRPYGLAVSQSGNRMVYTTTATGSSASISQSYDEGTDSAMEAIFGKVVTVYPGATASLDSDNNLTIHNDSTNPYKGISMSYGTTITSDIPLNPVAGYASSKRSYIQGRANAAPIVIDEWNDDLSFSYHRDGTQLTYDFALPHGSYSYFALADALQGKLDALDSLHTLTASVNSSGQVRLEAKNPGSKYYFDSDFQGDFYDKVICGAAERVETRDPEINNGTDHLSPAYAVGRKDVTGTTVIRAGSNDTLSLELRYIDSGGKEDITEFEMKLDPGSYSGSGLIDMIQDKLNEQLAAKGYETGAIRVAIGEKKTGIHGANDSVCLNFILSTEVDLPKDGTYIIEGIGGNAAFSIFYPTSGEMIPAYTKGTKDISGGAKITPENNTLSFEADGAPYEVTLPDGDYTQDTIISTLNSLLESSSAPVRASIEDGSLKLGYTKLGKHSITKVGGSARDTLFFDTLSAKRERRGDEGIWIQQSGEAYDRRFIEKPPLSSKSLRIDRISVLDPLRGTIALKKLDGAFKEVSEMRTNYGVKTNGFEHAIKINDATSENTQSAESIIRDTDMAKEMVELSKHRILENMSMAMLAQGARRGEDVLRLLK